MVRKGGPNNTLHHFADLLCRGFSKNARRDFKNDQSREKKERERWRSRKSSRNHSERGYESDSWIDIEDDHYPKSNSTPNIGNAGSPRLSPGLTPRYPSTQLAPSSPKRLQPVSNSGYQPVGELNQWRPPPSLAPEHPSSPQEPTRIGWAPESSHDSVRTSSSRRTQSPKLAPIHEPTAIPMTVERDSAMRPTYQAPLGDNARTVIEGMRPPTAFDTRRHRRSR